jgi:hypothetical protein
MRGADRGAWADKHPSSVYGNASMGAEWMPESKRIFGRIETVPKLSDQAAAVTSLSGGPPVTFLPAMCVRISVLDWIVLIGITVFIATELQTLKAISMDLSLLKTL